MKEKKSKCGTRCSTTRVKPSLRKIHKSIRLSLWLSSKIDLYAIRYKLNRSQVIERGMMQFLSSEKYDLIAEYKATKIKLAMLGQELKNDDEIKELLEVKNDR